MLAIVQGREGQDASLPWLMPRRRLNKRPDAKPPWTRHYHNYRGIEICEFRGTETGCLVPWREDRIESLLAAQVLVDEKIRKWVEWFNASEDSGCCAPRTRAQDAMCTFWLRTGIIIPIKERFEHLVDEGVIFTYIENFWRWVEDRLTGRTTLQKPSLKVRTSLQFARIMATPEDFERKWALYKKVRAYSPRPRKREKAWIDPARSKKRKHRRAPREFPDANP